MLDNDPLVLDESIPTYNRTGNKLYKDIQYNEKYMPQDFTNSSHNQKHVTILDQKYDLPDKQSTDQFNKTKSKRSERLKDQSRTK